MIIEDEDYLEELLKHEPLPNVRLQPDIFIENGELETFDLTDYGLDGSVT